MTTNSILVIALFGMSAANAIAQPAITQQPADQSVSLGANVTFQITVTGTPPLTYQWRFNGSELGGATNRTLLLTNVQTSAAGGYLVVVSNATGSLTSRVAALSIDASFTKITTGPIATQGGACIACAWGDYDNDGLLDLYVNNRSRRNFLYRNKGGGEFEQITGGHLLTDTATHMGGVWVDYDNDGYLDIFVTNGGAESTAGNQTNYLYHNNRDGTFSQPSAAALGTIVTDAGGFHGAAWGDYDGDGFLDVFVANTTGNNYLYRNVGGTNFVRVRTIESRCGGGACVDYDHDGDQDLFIMTHLNSGGLRKNFLYRNDGLGVLTRVTTGPMVLEVFEGWGGGVTWGDYNNDGLLDLFVSNFPGGRDLLYRNLGNGAFAKITNNPLVNEIADTYGAAWGDYDNDGFMDLFVATGLYGSGGLDNYLFRNQGDGTFVKILAGSLVNDQGHSASCAWADYDKDGFLDLFVGNDPSFDAPGTSEVNFLYRNNGNANTWLQVRCVGTVSNRDGIGAKVIVKARYAGQDRLQLRHIASGDGTVAGSLEAHFGLGDAAIIDTLRIEWPSGIVQELHAVSVKQHLTVTEPARLEPYVTQANGIVDLKVKSWKGFAYDIETSNDLKAWTHLTTLTNETGTLSFADPLAGEAAQRFYRAVGK